MLKIVRTMSELKFGMLMEVYSESNTLTGAEQYPHLSASEQLIAAEQDFYQYLNQIFFKQAGSFYAVWDLDNNYVAALRLEPYRDGFLLCALETSPDFRRKGFANKLIAGVVDYLSQQGSGTLYSHVSKSNIASLSVHDKCGFKLFADQAVYADGSVLQNAVTLVFQY